MRIYALINDNGAVEFNFEKKELEQTAKDLNSLNDFGLIHDVISVDILGNVCQGENNLSVITCNNRPVEVIANNEDLFLERFKINNRNTSELRKYNTCYFTTINEMKTRDTDIKIGMIKQSMGV